MFKRKDERNVLDPVMERLPKGYVRHDDEFKIYQLVRKYQNPLWNNFVATDHFLMCIPSHTS